MALLSSASRRCEGNAGKSLPESKSGGGEPRRPYGFRGARVEQAGEHIVRLRDLEHCMASIRGKPVSRGLIPPTSKKRSGVRNEVRDRGRTCSIGSLAEGSLLLVGVSLFKFRSESERVAVVVDDGFASAQSRGVGTRSRHGGNWRRVGLRHDSLLASSLDSSA
jgi:hypothetical protein